MTKIKKEPKDYPLFSFRLYSEEQKKRLDQMVREVQERRRSDENGMKSISKSAILLEAIERGLSEMSKSAKTKAKK